MATHYCIGCRALALACFSRSLPSVLAARVFSVEPKLTLDEAVTKVCACARADPPLLPPPPPLPPPPAAAAAPLSVQQNNVVATQCVRRDAFNHPQPERTIVTHTRKRHLWRCHSHGDKRIHNRNPRQNLSASPTSSSDISLSKVGLARVSHKLPDTRLAMQSYKVTSTVKTSKR